MPLNLRELLGPPSYRAVYILNLALSGFQPSWTFSYRVEKYFTFLYALTKLEDNWEI